MVSVVRGYVAMFGGRASVRAAPPLARRVAGRETLWRVGPVSGRRVVQRGSAGCCGQHRPDGESGGRRLARGCLAGARPGGKRVAYCCRDPDAELLEPGVVSRWPLPRCARTTRWRGSSGDSLGPAYAPLGGAERTTGGPGSQLPAERGLPAGSLPVGEFKFAAAYTPRAGHPRGSPPGLPTAAGTFRRVPAGPCDAKSPRASGASPADSSPS